MVVLSHIQAEVLLAGFQAGTSQVAVSPNFGTTTGSARLEDDRVIFEDGTTLVQPVLEDIAGDENGCYLIESEQAHRIQFYSELTGRVCSLYLTRGAPTLLMAGLPMHRIKGTDPWSDTQEKIRAAKPVGQVLDTTTGLGYTAIQVARTAKQVTTIELDPAALEVARCNP